MIFKAKNVERKTHLGIAGLEIVDHNEHPAN